MANAAQAFAVLLFTGTGAKLTLAAVHGEDEKVRKQTRDVVRLEALDVSDDALLREIVGGSASLCVNALGSWLTTSGHDSSHADALRRLHVERLLAVPFRVAAQVIGCIEIVRSAAEPPFENDDVEIVQDLARHAALAMLHASVTERSGPSTDAEQFLDAIIENIPNMIFVKDAERLAFQRFNRAGEQLLGLSRHDLLGKNDYDFFPEAEAAFFQAKDRETLRGRVLVDIPEEPIDTNAGQRWLHTMKVPILDPTGMPKYLLGISEDITDRKTAEAALREAKEAAEMANKELEAFSYSVAHDLRAPLRHINGFSQALVEDCADKLDENAQRYLERIRHAAAKMANLIDDLLTLSRITRAELRKERVDLSALAHAVVAGLERSHPDRKVDVSIQKDLQGEGDPRLLTIVLDNLLGNAWKFTSKRNQPHIEVGAKAENDRTVYFVSDNGAGFDPTYKDKLFRVFERLHSASEFDGTGIGLATVQRIIVRHGGRIWAEGEVDRGASFYFTLA